MTCKRITCKIITDSKRKEEKEVYKDPIFGIPHLHDPAIMRIVEKHDPYKQMNESMKLMAKKSQQRLRAVKSAKPRFIHSRFNMDALKKSPLMCFPHFDEMTTYLDQWFTNRNQMEASILTSNQRGTFIALSKFCDSLFLLLQETARASPISPAPLSGIYKWYLQRDTVINQSKNLNMPTQNENVTIIELPNGKKIEINNNDLNPKYILSRVTLTPEMILNEFDAVKKEPPLVERKVEKKKVTKSPTILLNPVVPPLKKREDEFEEKKEENKFDYAKLHKRLVAEREAEEEVDRMATALARKTHLGVRSYTLRK